MKLAICNETYGDWPFERVCADVAACGYQGIEVTPYTLEPDPRRLDEARAQHFGDIAYRAGLAVAAFHWLLVQPPGLHVTTADAAVRARTAEHLAFLARACAAMGGRILVLGSPAQRSLLPGVAYADGFARAVEVLHGVAETCAPLGVTLALEPLSPALTDFLNTAAETVRLIEVVDHPACRLHLDVSAMSTEGRPIPDIVRAHARHLAHFHANDPNRRGPGQGDVDFRPILQVLDEVGYDGWISVEVFDYTPDGPSIARQSMAALRAAMP